MTDPLRTHLVAGSVQERIQAVSEVELLRARVGALTDKVELLEGLLFDHLRRTWRVRWRRLRDWMYKQVNG